VLELRHYIRTPEGVIGIVTRRSNAVNDARYWHKDHLGSLVVITDAAGTVKEKFGYDAWGNRTVITDAGATGDPYNEERGYTGHEQLVEVGLTHMNGRIYDPATGRFLQADPIVQDPWNGQNYNRYGYVLNNPLSFTDPTGYSFWTKWRRPIIAAAVAIATYGAASALMAAAALEAGGATAFAAVADSQYGATVATLTPLGSAAAGAAAGFAAGGIAGGNIESALYAAVTGGVSSGVASAFGESWNIGRVAAQTATSAAMAYATGQDAGRAARIALATSLIQFGASVMRDATIESSRRFDGICASGGAGEVCFDNKSGPSAGLNGDMFKAAGTRLVIDQICAGEGITCTTGTASGRPMWFYAAEGDAAEILTARVYAQGGPLGFVQGLPGRMFNIPYPPGGFVDRFVTEPFSGTHDVFNSGIWYDPLGNGRSLSGAAALFGNVMNGVNVLLAAPFAAAALLPPGIVDALTARVGR
jgi:RHS repeat-associated protein